MSEIPPTIPTLSARKRFAPLFWLSGGLALGLLAAGTLLRGGGDETEPVGTPLQPQPAVVTPQGTPVADPSLDQADVEGKFGVRPGQESPAGAPGAATTGPHAPNTSVTAPPEPLTGALPSGPMPSPVGPLKPIVIDDSPPSAAVQSSYFEIMDVVGETDFDAAVGRARSLAASNGAQVLLEFRLDPGRPEVGLDLFISVPRANAVKLREDLARAGSAQETEQWTGPHSERHARVERDYRERARQLESKLRQLLVKYLEDAPEVVRTQESLDRMKKALGSLKPVGPERDVVRVFVGKSPPWSQPK